MRVVQLDNSLRATDKDNVYTFVTSINQMSLQWPNQQHRITMKAKCLNRSSCCNAQHYKPVSNAGWEAE